MSSDFELVKPALNIKAVITAESGFQMKGKHLEQCPMCSGHGCFSIQDNEQLFKCFQCGAGGDVFTFLELFHSLDKGEALKMAAGLAGIALTERKKAPEVRLSRRDKLMLDAADYYHGHMLVNGGKAYLTETRGHDMEVLKAMKVGWSDGQLIDHLQSKGYTPAEIIDAGLAREKDIEGAARVLDFFGKGLAIYPHIERGRVLHFTMKDPAKKLAYQLPAEKRHKQWRFYNQEAMEKFQELILVEGEDDTLSVIDTKTKNVVGMIGQISDEQIKHLKSACRGKKLYLWMDNDEEPGKPFAKGIGYVRKICRALMPEINVRVITYPDTVKDPDDYLRGFEGDRRKEIKRLMDEAVDYLTWEIGRAGRLATLEERFDHLKEMEVFRLVATEADVQQQIYIEKMEGIGFTEKGIRHQIENGLELRRLVSVYIENMGGPKNVEPNALAAIIYKEMARDGRFFWNAANKVYLLLNHQIYEVGNNRPFNALMKRHTMLLPNLAPGPSVWESLASEGYNAGRKIDVARWVHTDLATDSIFINLNSPGNTIIKMSAKGGISEIPNGLNEDSVLLQSSKKIQPFNFRPDADIHEGFVAYKELVQDAFTCAPEQRYLITCWLLTFVLLDLVSSQGHMKFSGGSGCGKSTAAKLITVLLYGDGHLEDPSAAAAYSMAAQNPILVIDNLESDDVTKSILKFLLLAATRGQKSKRAGGTESDTTEESPRALVLITAIEPFTKPELINRTVDIEFGKEWQSDDFIEDEVTRALVKKRDLILSAFIKLIQKEILPNLARRREYITILQKEYRGHSKDRMNEFWALMMLLLEKTLPHMPFYGEDDFRHGIETGEKEIRKAWIDYQNTKAKDTEIGSNNILKLLDGVVREYMLKMRELSLPLKDKIGYDEPVFEWTHPEYGLDMVKTKPVYDTENDCTTSHIEFETTSKELALVFDRFCRNNGKHNPYDTGAKLGARLKNDLPLLKKGGWDLVPGKDGKMHSKVVHGQRFLKFRHTVVR
ncbi:MAG: CHC2 zinc finger domain-containing protein [Desulfobulbaceae bacterium]|nr:CHC2 zinc finger domain-containing protein [Desulfobulbaceae bacterium]